MISQPTPVHPGSANAQSPATPVEPVIDETAMPWAELGVFCGLAVAMVTALSVPLALGVFDDTVASTVVMFGQFAPLAASVATWLLFGRRERLRDLWALRVPRGRALAAGLGWALVAVLVVAVAQALAHLAMAALTGRPLGFASGQLPMAAAVLPVALAMCLPCFGEEVGWRGHLWRLLARGPAWRRIVLASLVWALWHGPLLVGYVVSGLMDDRSAAVAMVNVFFAGLVLGWLRERSGTVWPAVVGHALLNSALVYLTGLMTPPSEQSTWPLWQLVVFTAVGALAWCLLARRLSRR
ncbi:lysostaphin resistance A-like protein [Aestuariimicrobium soli]|uniref:CPBP family intramembrane glutamic endopeptidase n=1 Tax=Aestuariimicrobium soli TaxID=2035834 RepID=UPI003EBD5D3C